MALVAGFPASEYNRPCAQFIQGKAPEPAILAKTMGCQKSARDTVAAHDTHQQKEQPHDLGRHVKFATHKSASAWLRSRSLFGFHALTLNWGSQRRFPYVADLLPYFAVPMAENDWLSIVY